MRRVHASVAVALASSLALFQSACVLTGKPKTSTAAAPPPPKPAVVKPAAPPESLSVPQTQVQLPPPQPINPDAVALPAPKSEAGAPPPAASRPVRRTAPPQPKPETPVPAAPTPAPADAELAPVQEVLTAAERKRFKDSADARKTEIRQLLTQIKSHHPTAEANREVKRVQSLVAQSDDVEKHGDMRQADALAERALILARELTGGK